MLKLSTEMKINEEEMEDDSTLSATRRLLPNFDPVHSLLLPPNFPNTIDVIAFPLVLLSLKMSMNKESLTDEEAIQLRLQLGLSAPGVAAADGGEPPVDTDAIAEENYSQRKAEMKREKEERELKERIEK